MKNLLNKNISIYTYRILLNNEFEEFKNLLQDFDNWDEDEFIDLVYGKDGLLNQQIYKIDVVVDYGAKMILSISPR